MIGKYDITQVKARQIFDSRGNPTIECDVWVGKGFGRASVPSGKSTGKHEALELRDKGKAYHGLGVTKAVDNANALGKKIVGMDCRDQEGVDNRLIEMDGTKNKGKMGSNAILAISIAINKAASNAKEVPVYNHIGQIYSHHAPNPMVPVPFFNIINGGAHSSNKLDVQEFMIVPKTDSFAEAMRVSIETYHELQALLEKKFGTIGVGDEGGFAPPLKKTTEALDFIVKASEKAGHAKKVFIALDSAATSFYKARKYKLDGKQMNADKLVDYYEKLTEKYPIVSIEDPFAEDDFKGFSKLNERIGEKVQIIGDDLFCTNVDRLITGIRERSANCVLLKPNQIGSVSEVFEACHLARNSNLAVMMSHRSGETCEDFIADLAVGMTTKQIKSGAPCRGERLAKYNQLLRIEEQEIPYSQWFK